MKKKKKEMINMKNLKKMATMIRKMRRSFMKMTMLIKVENWHCTKQFVTISNIVCHKSRAILK